MALPALPAHNAPPAPEIEDIPPSEADTGTDADIGDIGDIGDTGDFGEDEDGDMDGFDPLQMVAQLFVTSETGETLADVLAGIRASLDKTAKVLYRISNQLEKK